MKTRCVHVIFICLLFAFFPASKLPGAGFDANLERVHSLWEKKQFAALIPVLQSLGQTPLLEDLRLYLLAESYKQSGQEGESLRLLEGLIQKYPETLGGRKGLFSYVILAAKLKGPPALPMLLKLARSLPTAYQRGRALEACMDLHPAGTRERSLQLLEAMRAYRSNSWFYQNMEESVDLLKRFLNEYSQWRLNRDEWIELLLAANREKLGNMVGRMLPAVASAMGEHGKVVGLIIEADALRYLGQKERSVNLLNGILTAKTLDPAVRALAFQARGDLFNSMSRNEAAMADYSSALAWNKPPIDWVTCAYRNMRSAFEAGFDEKSLEMAKRLCSENLDIPLLPVHLYEMGLSRYDSGRGAAAVPYFLLLQKYFPGHYRADDALGYGAVALGSKTAEGKRLLALLARVYPHSFFLYWLDPNNRNRPLQTPPVQTPISPWVKNRVGAWRVLLASSFDDMAREEIRQLMDERPTDLGFFKGLVELNQSVNDFNQVTACGERMLKNILNAGKSSGDLPLWAWQAYFPRPFWRKVRQEAQSNQIDPYWILSVMREESHFNPKTLSHSNAMGLMQILPSTGKWIAGKLGIKGKFNKNTLWDPNCNISFGAWYLEYLKDLFQGDLFLAAASYNGGQGNITRKVQQGPYAALPVLSRLDRVPLPETRDYYKKVMGSWWCYRRIYGNN